MNISKKDQIAYWSSEAFLHKYYQKLEFNEPYAKAFGTVTLGWVVSPWRQHLKEIVFKYTRDYLMKHKKLPEGEVTFDVDWKISKPKWLIKSLRKKQIVTFPRL